MVDIRTCLLVVCWMLLVVAAAAPAQDKKGQLYRWTDDQGVVHYSDRKPPDRSVETRSLTREPDSRPAAAEPAAEDSRSASCKRSQQNVQVLTTSGEVRMDLDGDGEPELLDAAARERELARARELVRTHCAR